MLKPRNAYVNELAYNNALFNNKATVEAFAIGINNGSQVKFSLENSDTKETGIKSRFHFFLENERSTAYSLEDAKEIVELINTIKTSKVAVLTAVKSSIVYTKYSNVKGKNSYDFGVKFSGRTRNMFRDWVPTKSELEIDKDIVRNNFLKSLGRLEEVLKYFIAKVEGETVKRPDYHFALGKFVQYPLNNSAKSSRGHYYLRSHSHNGADINSIAFCCGDNTVLFYGLLSKGKNSSTIHEVVEAFINALMDLEIDFLKSTPNADTLGYHRVFGLRSTLSNDRANFMEYVSGRETLSSTDERKMIININTEAAPSFSKVHFHYNHDFICDLAFGLRFLVK